MSSLSKALGISDFLVYSNQKWSEHDFKAKTRFEINRSGRAVSLRCITRSVSLTTSLVYEVTGLTLSHVFVI